MYWLVCACVIMETILNYVRLCPLGHLEIWYTMSNANIGLCSLMRPNFL